MSHFSVMVIGENIEDQLEKYSENIEVPQYIVGEVSQKDKDSFIEYYCKENNIIGEVSFEDLYKEYGKRWNDNSWKIKDGIWAEVSTYNPNSKWDWYELGGRWTGFLKSEQGYADQMLKSEIDLIGMQKKAKENAIESWNKANEIIRGEFFIEWSQFLSMVDKKEIDINVAREQYQAQPIIKRWNKSKDFGLFSDIEDYNVPIEEFIERQVNSVLSTYAVVKNGEWYAKGEMGWFGMSDDKQTQEEWNESIMKMFNELPDDTLISIVDCHI